VAERNTAVQLAFSDGVLTLDAGSGEEAMASESIEAVTTGDDLTTGFNPQFCSTGSPPWSAVRGTRLHHIVQAGRTLGSGLARRRKHDGLQLQVPLDAAPPAFLTCRRTAPRPRAALTEGRACTSDSSASQDGWQHAHPSAQRWSHGDRFRSQSDVTDVASLADMVAALPSPKVVWVMVPAGDRPPTRSTSWRACSVPGTRR